MPLPTLYKIQMPRRRAAALPRICRYAVRHIGNSSKMQPIAWVHEIYSPKLLVISYFFCIFAV